MSRTAARPRPATGGFCVSYATSYVRPALIPDFKRMEFGSGTTVPFSSRANCHWSRGISRDGAKIPSRSVKRYCGLSRSSGGYARVLYPPAYEYENVALSEMNHIRTQPVIGLPLSVAIGALSPTSPLPLATSNCQPTATSVYPWFSRYASPKSASLVGSADPPPRLNDRSNCLFPRFTMSKKTTPLPREGSFGLMM